MGVQKSVTKMCSNGTVAKIIIQNTAKQPFSPGTPYPFHYIAFSNFSLHHNAGDNRICADATALHKPCKSLINGSRISKSRMAEV